MGAGINNNVHAYFLFEGKQSVSVSDVNAIWEITCPRQDVPTDTHTHAGCTPLNKVDRKSGENWTIISRIIIVSRGLGEIFAQLDS